MDKKGNIMIEYGYYKELDKSFNQTAEIILNLLQTHKFTIATQIDLKQKFKDKLNVDYPQYTVLGLCDVQIGYKAIQAEQNMGLMIPCNMAVYEKGNKTVIAVIKPTKIMENIQNPALDEILQGMDKRLKALFESIK